MRIEDVQEIATRAEQLLRLTVDREFGIHAEDGGGFVPTVTEEEQGAGQFVATARLTRDGKSTAGWAAAPGLTLRAIGFTRYESLGALALAILQHVDKMKVSYQETAAACRDHSARMRLMAASRREKIAKASIALTLRSHDPKASLGSLIENLGYGVVEVGAHRVAGDGAWKAVLQGRSIYCEARSDTSLRDATLALAANFTTKVMEECELHERSAMKSDRKAMVYGLLADHFAAEAASIYLTIREATRR